MKRLLPLFASAIPVVLAGCAVGPDFKRPDAPTQTQYGASAPATTVSTPIAGGEAQSFSAGKVPEQWWKLFGSPKLDALVEQAFAGSPDLAAAQASLRRAGENYKAVRSSIWPSIDGRVGATRQKIDTSSFGNPAGGTAIYNLFNAGVDVSYALDIWGGVRRGLESQQAQYELQRYQYEGAYQALAANVVTTAIQEARLRALIAGKKSVIADLERLVDITQKRVDVGAVGRAELLSAQASAASERAILPALERELGQTQTQLAVYLGKAPSERVATDFDLAELTLPQELPVSLPSELVRQRPDLRAAEAALHQASADVGVATAQQLPQLTLSANYGSQALDAGSLFDTDIWSLGANISAPLFRGGQLSARKRAAVAGYDQALANYKLTALQSFKNVADSLRAIETDAQVLQAQYDAAKAADEGLALVRKQYEIGVIGYMDVLQVQQQTTTAKAGLVQALADRYQDTAALLLALGGGWSARETAAQQAQP